MKKIIVSMLGATLMISAQLLYSQWPQSGHDQGNTHLSTSTLDLGSSPDHFPINVAVDNNASGPYLSAPVISGGLVYLGTSKGDLFAVSVNTKSNKWQKSYGSNLAPAVFADVVVSTDGLTIYGLDAFSGNLIWQKQLPNPTFHDVLIGDDGIVYVFTEVGSGFALDVFTGEQRWSSDPGTVSNEFLTGMPAIANEGYVVISSKPNPNNNIGTVYALDRSTGGFAWRKTFPFSSATDENEINGLLADNNYVYFTNQPRRRGSVINHSFYCGINTTDRSVFYQVDSPDVYQYRTRLAILPNHTQIVYGSGDSFFPGIVQYNAIDGNGQKSVNNQVGQIMSPATAVAANGDIVVGDWFGFFRVVSSAGTIKHTFELKSGTHDNGLGSPALAAQFVVIAHEEHWGILHLIAKKGLGQFPEVTGEISDLELDVGSTETIGLQASPKVFIHPDGVPLSYSARSLNSTVSTVNVSGNLVVVKGESGGNTRIIITASDPNGNSVSVSFAVTVNESVTSIDDEGTVLLHSFSLGQNYPNPFNPTTNISYSVPSPGIVTLKIYDVRGKEIETLVNKFHSEGNYSVRFEPRNLSNGIYFYRLYKGNSSITRKMLFVQ